MLRTLYTLGFYLATPVVIGRLLWRSRKLPGYRQRLLERFGIFNAPNLSASIWVHAVSVGEVIASLPLIQGLLNEHPDTPIVVTTTTPTGSERLTQALADKVFHVYAPYDLPDCINRFLNKVKPKLAIFMETEIWPNQTLILSNKQIPLVLANARLSERSARGYQRVQKLIAAPIRAITKIAAQANSDAEHFRWLGANDAQITVTGSIKFDMPVPDDLMNKAKDYRALLGENRPVILAASTHAGEETQVLAAFKTLLQSHSNTLLMLAPRHPDRFDQVANLCQQQGFVTARRSLAEQVNEETQIYLADTMGELLLAYAAADLAFIGGSLMPIGGHNPLEPAAVNCPIITGPHEHNFLRINTLLRDQDAIVMINNSAQLAEQWQTLLTNKERRQTLAENAEKVVEQNRGALAKHLQLVRDLLTP